MQANDANQLAHDDADFIAAVRNTHGISATEHMSDRWWSTTNAMTMSATVLTFGLLVICISAGLSLKRVHRDVVLRIVIVPMSIMSALFLVVAGYDDHQVAPAMGLLGTIVGYVLGNRLPPGETQQVLRETPALDRPESTKPL